MTWRCCLLLSCFLYSHLALATVQRFALLIGNNRGQGADVELRYAESDAARVSRVLRDVGDFEPADVVLLQAESANVARKSLISLNDRIRLAQTLPDVETLLLVYYSGHADAQALHLGNTRLEFVELAQLVRGSAAKFRLLVVDACRSGSLTRVKGGKIIAPFELTESSLTGEGLAFLTASSANEDAQESDEIRGSFFTHAFVSGLLGAADRDSNGVVGLEEAYSYASAATIRATSSTFAGTQHPTFQYEVKGQGSLVVTRPGQARRAAIVFPTGANYLVMAGNEHGAVVGEVGSGDSGRSLSVAPGRYFVRGRAADHLLEGTVQVQTGEQRRIDPAELDRVEYARLVRKGGTSYRLAHGPQAGLLLRPAWLDNANACLGATAAYRVDFESISLRGHFEYCASSFSNQVLDAHNREFGAALSIERAMDFRRLSVFGGLGVGASLLNQTFATRGVAPSRLSWSPGAMLLLGASTPLARRLYLGGDMRISGRLVRFQYNAFSSTELRLRSALEWAFYAGMQW